MDEEAKKKIALFRFSLIAPLINQNFKEATAKAYIESICAKTYDVPFYGTKEYAPETIKGWLLDYRKHGIEGLYPLTRSDKEKSRSLTDELKHYILDAKDLKPERSAKSIYHELIAKGLITSNDISLSTIQRFIKNHGLKKSELQTKDRRSFEMEYPGDCWQTDITMGPYLTINGRKHKTYIIAFIDDSSRAVMACKAFFEQNLYAVLSLFKTAIQRRGIPKKLFMDNGKVFHADQLQFICASLGTVVSFAEAFSPQSKGKVERWFQTLQRQWMNLLDWNNISSIEEFNEMLTNYVENTYNQSIHSSIKMRPIDKYIQHIDKIRFVSSKQELDNIFLYRIERRVKNDATIPISNYIFEVPAKYIGERIKVCYDPASLDKAFIFDDSGSCICTIYPVNKVANSKVIRDSAKKAADFSPFNIMEDKK